MVHAVLLLVASQALVAPPGRPVRVWLGPSARVYVQTSTDGHLVVLRARSDGRVEVLFPTDPTRDPFVHAGTYEIPGSGEDPVLAASEPEGRGMVVAALSPDPIWFDEFVHRSVWNADALAGAAAERHADPEALLTDIVQRMLGDGFFNYDVATYVVSSPPLPIVRATTEAAQADIACSECEVTATTQVEVIVVGDLRVHPLHRRRRVPAPAGGAAVPPDAPALAVYSVHRPGPLPLPFHARLPRDVRPGRPAAQPIMPRHRSQVAPLVARERPPMARAATPPRMLLLIRAAAAARSRSQGLAPVDAAPSAGEVTVALRASAPPVQARARNGLAAAPAPPPVQARGIYREIPQGTPIPAACAGRGGVAAAQAGPPPSNGIGLKAVHTAGWRH